MQVNDLLHVHTQPKNLTNDVKGFVGFVEEVQDEQVLFHQLTEDGMGGSGWIPVDCVSIVNSNPYIHHLKQIYDEKINRLCREMESFAVKASQIKEKYIIQAMASAPGIDRATIEMIFDLVENYIVEINGERK